MNDRDYGSRYPQHLYAPWRSKYFQSEVEECVFCSMSVQKVTDRENMVFYRDDTCFAVMNLYPYTPGHFMIIPHSHVDSPLLLSGDEWSHISGMARAAVALLDDYGAHGVNFGINIGQAAGAGIPSHLHLHFVPRFLGDTNFITTVGNSRVYGTDFDKVFDDISSLARRYFR